MSNTKSSDSRSRNWTFVLYPESAPADWREQLNTFVGCVSPIHDRDMNPTGEPKKAHYHVVLAFEGKKSYEQIALITGALNATIPQRVESMQGMLRYLTHADNPEKAQYSKTDIVCFGGFDLVGYQMPTKSERYQYLKEMIDFIEENNIIEFEDLVIASMSEDYKDTWFPLLADNSTMFINAFIKSRRHRGEFKGRKWSLLNDFEVVPRPSDNWVDKCNNTSLEDCQVF